MKWTEIPFIDPNEGKNQSALLHISREAATNICGQGVGFSAAQNESQTRAHRVLKVAKGTCGDSHVLQLERGGRK